MAVQYDEKGERIGHRTSWGRLERVVRDVVGSRVRIEIDRNVAQHGQEVAREVRRCRAEERSRRRSMRWDCVSDGSKNEEFITGRRHPAIGRRHPL